MSNPFLKSRHGNICHGVSPDMSGFFWLLRTVKKRHIPVKMVDRLPIMDYIRA